MSSSTGTAPSASPSKSRNRIKTGQRPNFLPLSFAQERLWFFDQLHPGNTAYTMMSALRLKGSLRVPILEAALNQLLSRHESLRTRFISPDGVPSQIVDPPQALRLSPERIAGVGTSRAEAELEKLLAQEAARVFDLASGPLVRAMLLATAEDEHVLVVTMHHIVSDGWSVGVLMRELGQAYRALLADGPPLPALPVQYPDFAIWQREWLSGAELERQLVYWRQRLSGAPATVSLPTDRLRPAVQSLRGARASFVLPEALAVALTAAARAEQVTLFMLLLAAFMLLLRRYSGQEDLVVGTLIANRTEPETEGLIGFFVNMLALRTDLSGDPSFRELLRRVRDTALGAYAHQALPFEKVVEALQPSRDLAYHPIFQVMLVLQNTANQPLELPDVAVSEIPIPRETTHFDLLVSLSRTPQGLAATIDYSSDLFDEPTIARLFAHFQNLLTAAVRAPQARISDLSVLSEAERDMILRDWNDTAVPYPRDSPFPDLFAEQVRRRPEAVAASCGERSLTYAQLDRLSTGLAHRLAQASVGPETVVGVALERGIELLAALIAIMKCGGVYLPLDPGYAQDRLDTILRQAEPRCVIADAASEPAIQRALARRSEILLPTDWSARDLAAGAFAPGGPLSPRALAYIIFTSGSTGAPKGAAVESRGMINHLHAKIRDLALTERDILAQTASQCFDISIWQFLAPLLVGGAVCIYGEDLKLDPAALMKALAEDGVTIFQPVPSLLRALLEQPPDPAGEGLPRMRWIVPTGEELPRDLVRLWFERYPAIGMINAYGPTECSDDVTHHVMRSAGPANEPISIGRPVANTRAYVLDRRFEPLPIGVPGELFIAGDGVGRGYWRQPGLTAECFVPNPFGEGERLYRTGDLARWKAGGTLEFLGRSDHQVKIRGYRIELGEIEAALIAHEGVRSAVVVALGDGAGKRLVAYIARRPDAPPDEAALRNFLAQRLPDYMVPSAFVILDKLPVTANGKVDRKALPAPNAERTCTAYTAPSSREETALAALWAEVLRVPKVGLDDNFFDLGGHSLLIMQIVARGAQKGIRLDARDFFTRPTIRQQVAGASSAPERLRPARHGLVRLSEGTGTPFFLVHPISGQVGCYADLARNLGNRVVIGIEAQGIADHLPPLSDIPAMASRVLELLRSSAVPVHAIGGWSFGALVAFEAARHLLQTEGKTPRVVMVDPPAPSTFALDEPYLEREAWRQFARHYSFLKMMSGSPDADIAGLPLSERIARLQRSNPDFSVDQLRAWFDVIAANCRAWARYRPSPAPCAIVNILPRDASSSDTRSRMFWREQGTSYVEHVADGDHFSMFSPPAVQKLAALLGDLLEP